MEGVSHVNAFHVNDGDLPPGAQLTSVLNIE